MPIIELNLAAYLHVPDGAQPVFNDRHEVVALRLEDGRVWHPQLVLVPDAALPDGPLAPEVELLEYLECRIEWLHEDR